MSRRFDVGDRVCVKRGAPEYTSKYEGCVGSVQRVFNRSGTSNVIGVNLKGHRNRCESGLFWFKPSSLMRVPETPAESESSFEFDFESEEITMFEKFNVAEVELAGDCSRSVLCALYDPYVVDDNVVVFTSNKGFSVGTIVEITCNNDAMQSQVPSGNEVVCKVDFTPYTQRKESRKRRAELKRKMDKKLREMQSMAVYEMFAEKDPTLKAMLDEFKGLDTSMQEDN